MKAAALVGEKPDPTWTEIADKMFIPFDEKQQRHLDFDATVPHDKITWMGSSLAWLMYPNLDLPMSPEIRRNDFDFQLEELKVHGDDPNEMMMVMLAVGAAEIGDAAAAGAWIERNLVGFLKAPFNVRTETAANNAGYILATSAGFVQSFVYGLTGLRIDDKGLDAAYAPDAAAEVERGDVEEYLVPRQALRHPRRSRRGRQGPSAAQRAVIGMHLPRLSTHESNACAGLRRGAIHRARNARKTDAMNRAPTAATHNK